MLAVTAFGLARVAGKRRKAIVDHAVRIATERLKGRPARGIDARIADVFWYGAVDIAARHCVVWIMLDGPASQDVPPWLTLEADGSLPAGKLLDAELAEWMRDQHREVLTAFRDAGWRSTTPAIGFESSERVAAGGGWFYFK